MMYDYLIVGAGFYGSIFAYEASKRGKKVLVIEKRNHIGGNVYSEEKNGIHIHKYGPHYFHTNDKALWNYLNSFVDFNTNDLNIYSSYKDRLFTMPINLKTFNELWGVKTAEEAMACLKEKRIDIKNPDNAEDYLLSVVGKEIYEIFFKGYTIKQWGKNPNLLPASIVKRIPIRFDFNSRYHNNSIYSGVPIGGWTQLFDKFLENIDVKLQTDFFDIEDWNTIANKLVYSGPIDRLGAMKYGKLDYRSLRFEEEEFDTTYQGNAVITYPDIEIPYTRVTEHKFFDFRGQKNTIISKEFPERYTGDNVPYYPLLDDKNKDKYEKYRKMFSKNKNVLIGGRLGSYQYYSMDQIIASALLLVKKEFTR